MMTLVTFFSEASSSLHLLAATATHTHAQHARITPGRQKKQCIRQLYLFSVIQRTTADMMLVPPALRKKNSEAAYEAVFILLA